ncbi:hypothetical protein MVG78_04605 [Roseomonas gilardii subsp. gilardii]|uniref:hypothetical protein n=1 Tax=Roseomonas gilardii TaxID=257708 RepID=UPI001FFB976A|nr:hypothetical protein [Roseomonas gilardii]UPG73438.1 hypothetical protein MVG78_04605 [Roseomonas gilardii subsp. gilardii]
MTLRIGWIGCGTHATQMLLPQLLRHDVELVALCDVDGAAWPRRGASSVCANGRPARPI